jgi:hypothetical protein
MFTTFRTLITTVTAGVMLFVSDVAAYAHGGEIEPSTTPTVVETSAGNSTTLIIVGGIIVVAAVVAIGVIAFARSRADQD